MDIKMRWRLFLRSLLLQSYWNFETMQGVGFSYSIEPWLKACFGKTPDQYLQARARHQECFNTQPYMAGFILGMVCALEEDAARAPETDRLARIDKMKALKKGAACALAGIGDALFWATLRPFCAALALVSALALWRVSERAAVIAAAVYLISYNAPSLYLRWRGIGLGYLWKEQIGLKLKAFPWQSWIQGLRWAGVFFVFTLAALLLGATGGDFNGLPVGAVVFAATALLKPRSFSISRLYLIVCLAGAGASAAGLQ